MKKSYIYIIFCLIFVFLPFCNPQKAFARETPTIRISTDKSYPVRVMDGKKPTNDWSIFGIISGTEPADTINVWLTQTEKGTNFKILPKTAKINKDSSGKAYSFNATFTNLESGRYTVHSTIDYKSDPYIDEKKVIVAKWKKTPEVTNTKNPVNYTTKIFDVTALPIIRNGEITIKHLGNDNFKVSTIIDSYDSSKNYSIYLKEKEKGTEIKNTSIARENSDKPTSQNLFAEFYNISGTFTAYVVYKEGVNTINMAEFSFSTGEVITRGEIIGNKKIIDNGVTIDPKINDVTVDVPENSNTFVLGITGADIPENSLYEVVIFDKELSKNTPTYIKPNTGAIKATNVGGFLDMKVTYTFDQIPKSGQYYVITKIKKNNASKTELDQRQSEVALNKEEKSANLSASNVYDTTNTENPDTKNLEGKYKLLVPLPGIGDTFDYSTPGAFQNLINTILKLIFGAITVYAVLLTIYWGIKYMMSDKEFIKSESKTKILNAIIAIVLALSSYLILNTINPDLVNLSVNGNQININVEGYQTFSSTEYKSITGKNVPTNPQIVTLVDRLSKENNIDRCMILTVIAHESGGKPGYGPDENVPKTKSRRAFIASGEKYSGKKFTPGDTSVLNDFKRDMSKPGWGLDWRFSKGIGFMQITFYPDNYGDNSTNYTANISNKNIVPTRTFNWRNGTKDVVTPAQMIDYEKNITIGTKLLKDNFTTCGGDTEKTFKAFHSGSCGTTDSFAVEQARARMATYNKCKQGATPL